VWLQIKLRPSLEMQVVVTNGPAALGFARTFIGLDLTEVRRGLGDFQTGSSRWPSINGGSSTR